MKSYALHGPLSTPLVSSRWLSNLKSTIEDFGSTIQAWSVRAQQRQILATVEDRILQDIGIDRVDAMVEVKKPFWQE